MTITTHAPLEFAAGDTWAIPGVLQDVNGVPLNLTGAVILWKLNTVDGDENLLTLAVGSGITISDPVTAAIRIEVTPDMSATVRPGHFYDWLHIKLPNGQEFTEWMGVIKTVRNPSNRYYMSAESGGFGVASGSEGMHKP